MSVASQADGGGLSHRLERALARLAADPRMEGSDIAAAIQAAGETAAEALGTGVSVCLPPAAAFHAGPSTDPSLEIPCAAPPLSGWIRLHAAPDRVWTAEETAFLQLAARQIERAGRAAALHAANRRYRAFLANSSESIGRIEFYEAIDLGQPEEAIVDQVYARGYVAECNDAFARQRGFANASETWGQRVSFVRDRHAPGHPREDRAIARARFRISNAPSVTLQHQGLARHFLNNMTGDYESGRLARFWAVGRDVTEQKAAENAERELRQRFATLVHNLDGIVWICEASSERFTFVSEQARRLLGYPVEQWTTEPGFWAAHLHPDDRDWVVESRRNAVARGEGEAMEYRMIDASGRAVWFKDSFTLVRHARSVTSLQGVLFDIGKERALEETLRALAAKSIAVREEERTRIAHEIHDELGQQLTILKFDLASLAATLRKDGPKSDPRVAEVSKISANVDAAVKTVRRIATELRPSALDHFGVAAAIEFQSREFQQRTGIVCRAARLDEVALESNLATTVFRIFQEALTNVARHAAATEVEVRLIAQDRTLTLVVKDNGCGFVAARDGGIRSLGVMGMKERARTAGGRLAIESTPGAGTRVTGWFPLEAPR